MTQKKRVVTGLLVLALAAVLSTGFLYAYFSDIEQSNGNQIDAGTLDLTVNGENPWDPDPILVSDVYPGYSSKALPLSVMNVGSIDGTLYVKFTVTAQRPGDTTEPEKALGTDDNGELGANLDMTITEGAASTTNKLDSWSAYVSLGDLHAGQTRELSLSYAVNSAVGNVIQGDGVTFSIEFYLEQKH